MAGKGTVAGQVSVRMYNVGFGDAFLVTVERGGRTWRMLVDCGVHAHGQARPLREVVQAIVADLRAASAGGSAYLDVVVATHHHADHIAGFALDEWEQVEVGEVWVPFVEDPDDPDASRLRRAHTLAAEGLEATLARFLAASGDSPLLQAAHAFAVNSRGNARATDRLLGRNGLGFAGKPTVRYLPHRSAAENVVATTVPDTVVHVLGPSRDPKDLRRMDPPAASAWLQLSADVLVPPEQRAPLFGPAFALGEEDVPEELREVLPHLRLGDVGVEESLLAASGLLENAVNNTSVFFVLDVAGTRLLFPGDAQQGAWDHVLDDPASRALVADARFYKIGHHGSHNATPRRFVEEVLQEGAEAMLPWGLVERWRETIPKAELLEALAARKHHVTRADSPVPVRGRVTVHDDLWSELRLRTG